MIRNIIPGPEPKGSGLSLCPEDRKPDPTSSSIVFLLLGQLRRGGRFSPNALEVAAGGGGILRDQHLQGVLRDGEVLGGLGHQLAVDVDG